MSEAAAMLTGTVAPPAVVAPPIVVLADPNASAPVLKPVEGVPDWAKDWTPELQATVAGAKWKDPRDAVESYAQLRKLESGEKISIVKDPADPAYAKMMAKLGAMEKPEDYISAYKPKEGVPAADEGFLKPMAAIAQKAGLTAHQWAVLSGGYDELAQAAQAGQGDAEAAALKREADGMEALKREWTGAKWDENSAHAQRAVRAAEIPQEDVQAFINALGVEKAFKMMAKLGSKFGVEAPFLDGGKQPVGGMTPEMARARIRELENDKGFAKRFKEGDIAARRELDTLHQYANQAVAA